MQLKHSMRQLTAFKGATHWLGDYFRRMKAKGGNKYAIIAVARKLAIIYYKMVTEKQSFKPVDADNTEKNIKQRGLLT
jgi:transposase